MVFLRSVPLDNDENYDVVDDAPWTEVLNEIVEDTIAPAEQNADVADYNIDFDIANNVEELSINPSAVGSLSSVSDDTAIQDYYDEHYVDVLEDIGYDQLWSDVMMTVFDDSGSSEDLEEPSNGNGLEIEVYYGPFSSISYTLDTSGLNGHPLIFYLLPDVLTFSPSRYSLAQYHSCVQLTPSVCSFHFNPSQYAINLLPSRSEVFHVPMNTHTIQIITSFIGSDFDEGDNGMFCGDIMEPSSRNVSNSVIRRQSDLSVVVFSNSFGNLPVESSNVPTSHISILTMLTGTSSVSSSQYTSYTYASCSFCVQPFPPMRFYNGSSDALINSSSSTLSFLRGIQSNSVDSHVPVVSSQNMHFSGHVCRARNKVNHKKRANHAKSKSVLVHCSEPEEENSSGRKRRRRVVNGLSLAGLEVEERDEAPSLNTNSKFYMLFRDEIALHLWNSFVQCSEEAQQQFLQAVSSRPSQKKRANRNSAVGQNYEEEESTSYFTAFNNLSDRQKSLLLGENMPYGMLVYLECLLLQHFEQEPDEEFVSPVLSSFERLILHAIANYYSLNSATVEDNDGSRYIVVNNNLSSFVLPSLKLTEYVQLRERK